MVVESRDQWRKRRGWVGHAPSFWQPADVPEQFSQLELKLAVRQIIYSNATRDVTFELYTKRTRILKPAYIPCLSLHLDAI